MGPSTSFSNSVIKSRSVKKAEKSLPQSTRRKKEVIKSLASKFNAKIQLEQKAGRKKNRLSEKENQWVINFLNWANISYTTAGRRDNVYLGKFNKVKKFAQKRYLLWTIRDIMAIINGSKTVQSEAPSDSFVAKFGKKITFRQLYGLLKRHKQYVFNRKIPQWSCLCEICENAVFLANGITKKLFPEGRLLETIHELVDTFSCNDTQDCTGKCEVCSSTKLTCDNFSTSSDSDSMSDDSSDSNEESHSDEDSICYYKWARYDDNKLQRVFFKTSIDKSIHLLNSTIKILKHHIHVKRVQFKYYNDAKANLAKNEILIHVDYSESYENKQQREI